MSEIVPILQTGRRAAMAGRRGLLISAFLALLVPIARGQALPAAEASHISTGFALPLESGSLSYAVSASEGLNWGFYSNDSRSSSSSVNGDLAYISLSKRDPFSAMAAGGHSFGFSGQPSYNYVSLGVSQVLALRKWTFILSDSLSYLPQTPTSGFAGIPGLGDLGVSSISIGVIPTSVISQPAQGVLTNYANRVENTVSGTVQRDLTAKTGLHGSAAYGITRFTNSSSAQNDAGLDSNAISAGGGVNHMYNRLNVFGLNYAYSDYTFSSGKTAIVEPEFTTQTASLNYMHEFSRRLGMTAAVGPQWTTVDYGTRTSSLNTFANVNVTYRNEYSRSALGYVRAANSGYGVISGALSDTVSYAGARTLARVWAAAVTASYSRSTTLPSPFLPSYTFNTAVVAGQVSRALPHSLSVFASYSLQSQSNQGAVLSVLNVFSGHYQTLGLGITYSPMAIHFGSH